MRVLTVTNMWPTNDSPYFGIFVKEQVKGIQEYYPEINNRIYFLNGKRSNLNYFWSIFKINWILIFRNFDVIHVHYGLTGIFLLFNPFIRTPVVITLHGSDFNAESKIIAKIVQSVLQKSTDIIYLNKMMFTKLQKLGKRMHHIPCGVNTNVFKPIGVAEKKEKIIIAFPSSKSRPVKNYRFFQEIIDHLEGEHNLRIEIIEINNKTREEINIILNSVDILCMTSITEGSPQIIKEAMCCNTSIVTSNVGDVAVLLNEVKNAIVIEGYQKEDYSEAIVHLLNQTKKFNDGRKKIFDLGLDEKSTSDKIVKVYSGC